MIKEKLMNNLFMKQFFKYNIGMKQIVVLMLGVLFITSCSKTVEIESSEAEQQYFYKTFSSLNESNSTFVDELPNGDIIIAGAWQSVGSAPRTVIIKRTDAFGTIIWKKEIPTAKEFYCQGAVMSNGDYVFNSAFSSTEVIRINADGKVIYHTEFDPTLRYNNWIGLPAEGENGSVLIPHTNGPGTGSASDTYIYTIGKQGNNERVQKLEDYDFNGKLLTIQVLKYVDGEYWITGTTYEAPFTGWSDVMKTFVAKVKHGTPATVYVKDSRDTKFGMQRVSAYTSDKQVVTVVTKTSAIWENQPNPQSSFDILKFGEDVDLKWQTTVALDVLTLEPLSLTENNKGEYVITGDCSVRGSSGRLPFVAKVNSSGDVTFTKIFRLAESVSFSYGLQSDDGSFIFTGSTSGFGNSLENFNIVLMKTDELGNRN
ncbi:MAG: hypothetical protein ACI8SE_002180 [Bacteroidia bacterium]|jgi:hypothetical protein